MMMMIMIMTLCAVMEMILEMMRRRRGDPIWNISRLTAAREATWKNIRFLGG
jgi:hypothetical protein